MRTVAPGTPPWIVSEARVRNRLQIENQFALLAFANPDLLFGKLLESGLRDPHHVVFEFEIRNAQLAASA